MFTTTFRPPYGRVPNQLKRMSPYPLILWSVDTLDWKHRDAKVITDRVNELVHPGGIILMHDIYPSSVKALPRIITNLKEKGYSFVTVDELFGSDTHPEEAVPGQVYFFSDLVLYEENAKE